MFSAFFYLLRARGIDVSLNEWMTLMRALELNLHHCSLTEFYYVSRMILVKSEADFDKFDMVFMEFFHDIAMEDNTPSDELMEWLRNPEMPDVKNMDFSDMLRTKKMDVDKVLADYKQRLREQTEQHDGGNYWDRTRRIHSLRQLRPASWRYSCWGSVSLSFRIPGY